MVVAAALIPGSAPTTPAADAVPADAASVLDRFVVAQLANDPGTLRSLAAPELTIAASLTPSGVTRSYVIKAAYDGAADTVTAHVRLVRDASHDTPAASFADETVKLVRSGEGQPFLVAVAAVSDFATEPDGPQVVHVSSGRDQSTLVLRIAFDSDLDPATVSGAVFTLTGAQGAALPTDVRYEVESRTVVIRVVEVPGGTLNLSVSDALHDIAGQALGGGYTTTVQG
jgi:hypothetical protein